MRVCWRAHRKSAAVSALSRPVSVRQLLTKHGVSTGRHARSRCKARCYERCKKPPTGRQDPANSAYPS
ncbi:hypothetical protein CSX11_22790 [Mycobacterium goodii]|nr:hypothetical protein CSX11_22790 [Mycolicibacterium goodii]